MIWLKTLLFTLCVPGVTLGLVPYLIVTRDAPAHPLGAVRWLGWALLALGVATMSWCFARFAVARGTPAPVDPPKELVVVGLYRYVRNPIYLGAFGILLGEILLTGSRALAVYAAAWALACHLFVVWYEEPALARRFGAAYDRYRATVPRWIPRRPRAIPPVSVSR
jgi:protein-S-isoprenylcysteine O-methyltransferase Ste14